MSSKALNPIGVLLKKDLHVFFSRPLFYVLAGVCALLWSPIYIYSFGEFLSQLVSTMGRDGEYISFQNRVVLDFVSLVNFLLLLFVNGITMVLVTEEKKNHTFDLLMTSPIRSWQIVAAKFSAGYIVVSMLLLISLLYPVTTSFFGHIHWQPLLSSYLGLFLFSAVYVAIGVFASSVTKSLLVAFLISLILNLALWFIGGIGAQVASTDGLLHFFEYINLEPIFKNFNTGVIRLSSVVFLLSLAFFASVAAERTIETSRWR
jgi:ABC-2 type transport system permease protein